MRTGFTAREVEVWDGVRRFWEVVVLEYRLWPLPIRFRVQVCVRLCRHLAAMNKVVCGVRNFIFHFLLFLKDGRLL